MKELKLVIAMAIILCSCSKIKKEQFTQEILKDGKIETKTIDIDFVTKDGAISSPHLRSIHCTNLESLSFPGNKLKNVVKHEKTLPYDLLSKDVKKGSPTYYTIFTAYHFIKASEYYTSLMSEYITPEIKESDKDIIVSIADYMPMANNNSRFIFSTKAAINPSSVYHKVGHRYEQFIKTKTNIVYKENRYIGIGFMEYFTTSLNQSPKIFEGVLPEALSRDVSKPVTLPIDMDQNSLYKGIMIMKESYIDVYNQEGSAMRQYIDIVLQSENILKNRYDSNLAALYITYPLWKIRETIGAEKTDRLVMHAWTILGNEGRKNSSFYTPNNGEEVSEKVCWYTVLHALLTADQQDFKGENNKLIRDIFASVKYPVDRVSN
ncbi:hypothetical protein K5X82_10400 [Halosquirtibacter xylanolyticus]|uniref:hypothetical protein n=1 Tax=Halosquirtibacter xylanolyticus TaxID=3374599 RepID=UPI0037496A29|nr:hypothetical protein K5X82_10400 [Prolixibacteraceae bacterium]